MKTNSLAISFNRSSFFGFAPAFMFTFMLVLVLLLGLLATAELASASPIVQQEFSETPDPYFAGDRVAKNGSRPKPPAFPPSNQSAETFSPLWITPQTNVKAEASPAFSKASVEWDAPLTDVQLSNRNADSTGSELGFNMAPLKIPSDKIAIPAPFQTDTNSIIRERKTATNDFDANAFGSTFQAEPSSKKLDPDRSTARNQSFEFDPARSTSNDLNESNSFLDQPMDPPMATDTRPSTMKSPGSSKSFGSAGSFGSSNAVGSSHTLEPKSTAPNRPQNAQVSYNSPVGAKSQKNAESAAEALTSFEPGKVLALVGGQPIFVGDMLFDINQIIEKRIPGAPPEVKERHRQDMIPQFLPQVVESKILFLGTMQMLPEGAKLEDVLEQAGKEFDDKHLEKMIEKSGLKSSGEFDANLRAMGSSIRQLRRSWAQDQLTKYFLSQQLNVTAEVTHQEMLDSYHENIETYAVPAKCRWEQVMIRFDRSSSRAAAKSEIVELGNQIVYGANLGAVAKKHSHGFMASEGGQHDWTTKNALVLKEIDEAIFSLPIGELSDIIESPDGYHVVRVIERTEATRKPFLDAQVEIKSRIELEKRKQAFDKHVAKLKREIPVEYFLNEDASKRIAASIPKTVDR